MLLVFTAHENVWGVLSVGSIDRAKRIIICQNLTLCLSAGTHGEEKLTHGEDRTEGVQPPYMYREHLQYVCECV